MKKLKVLTVVGTRPEIIRLSCTIIALDKSDAIDHVLVHTGQNYDYELNEVFFKNLGLRKPNYFLNAAEGNATITSGNILINIDPILEKERPDSFLVLGGYEFEGSSWCAVTTKSAVNCFGICGRGCSVSKAITTFTPTAKKNSIAIQLTLFIVPYFPPNIKCKNSKS